MSIYANLWLGIAFFYALVSSAQDKPKADINDQIYPPAQDASPFINFDGAGFSINGRRTFLASGSLHYPRVPHELWGDRLLRLKRAGFTGVQTYAFWNYHEPRENQFDFTGDKDLGKFLFTAQKLGLYATVRVGPYVCAEWDSGGYPIWLKFQPPFRVRDDNPEWLKWNDHWYGKILPLVASHQINHGGNVILVQLENEHPLGWGIVTNSPYFQHLSEEAVKLGIEVPYFMSGLNHGAAPAPGNLDSGRRRSPWYTTEFWAGWYSTYGTLSEKRNHEIEDAIWKIVAHGGGGYNIYMLHGGTDFDSWNGDEVAASYDDGAIIGQAGDLRPMYYRMKRANQLAQSFPDIIANGNDALASYANLATGPALKIIGARKSNTGAGTLVFLHNNADSKTIATFSSGDQFTLSRFGTYPIPQHVALAGGIEIVASTLPVLAAAKNRKASTVVVYGHAGDSGHLTFSSAFPVEPSASSPASTNFTVDLSNPTHPGMAIMIPADGVEECSLDSRGQLIRVLAINEELSLYTWFVGETNRQFVVLGSSYVQSVEEARGKISVAFERPYGQTAAGQIAVYGGAGQSWHLDATGDSSLEAQPAPALADWAMSPMNEASSVFNDSKWKHLDSPQQMGADGDISAFAWYRATVKIPSAGPGTLRFHGADNLEVFVNVEHVKSRKGAAQADFVAGTNTIAVFTSHRGRNKDYNYLGSLDNRDNKGLWDSVTLDLNGQSNAITGWSMRGGVEGDFHAIKKWQNLAETKNAPSFFRTTFKAVPPKEFGAHPILRVNYQGLSRGTMWINGHNLGRYPERINFDSLYIPECWLNKGQNTLTIFDETGASPAQVSLIIEHAASREVIRACQSVAASTPILIPHSVSQ